MDLALTADLGNSRLKLCVWSLVGDPRVVARASLESAPGAGARAAAFARATSGIGLCALSSVAGAALEHEVRGALSEALQRPVHLAPPAGLVLDVRAPERVGPDRVYAARGALALASGAPGLVVVDAGTALTVDALDVRGRRFLGGAIAPGPALLARALAQHTARLPHVEPAVGARALGRDTESALQAGIVVGFRGAARELALSVAAEAGFDAPPVVLTGGARALLITPPLFTRPGFGGVREDEDLVHRGLLAALREGLRA
ncbi:MAG: type III pantothenate kinase [Planctomycetes bacterium]|nr:type III pantothenate kinase [Planctomycetota bacterium]